MTRMELSPGKKAEVLFEEGKPVRLREYDAKGVRTSEYQIYDDGSLQKLLRGSGKYL